MGDCISRDAHPRYMATFVPLISKPLAPNYCPFSEERISSERFFCRKRSEKKTISCPRRFELTLPSTPFSRASTTAVIVSSNGAKQISAPCTPCCLSSSGGTIMSYCHSRFNSAGCLGNCVEPRNNSGYTTAFQSIASYFVVAGGGGGSVVNADRVAIGPWETFLLLDLNGGALESGDLVNIQTVTGYFVVAEGGGGGVVNANRTAALQWQTFRIERVDGGGTIGSVDAISLQA